MRNGKRLLRTTALRQAAGWIGSISAGIYTGLFTSNPLAGAAAFGAAKVGAEFLESLMAKSDVQELIRQDEMYFLWRVKQLAGSTRQEASPS